MCATRGAAQAAQRGAWPHRRACACCRWRLRARPRRRRAPRWPAGAPRRWRASQPARPGRRPPGCSRPPPPWPLDALRAPRQARVSAAGVHTCGAGAPLHCTVAQARGVPAGVRWAALLRTLRVRAQPMHATSAAGAHPAGRAARCCGSARCSRQRRPARRRRAPPAGRGPRTRWRCAARRSRRAPMPAAPRPGRPGRVPACPRSRPHCCRRPPRTRRRPAARPRGLRGAPRARSGRGAQSGRERLAGGALARPRCNRTAALLGRACARGGRGAGGGRLAPHHAVRVQAVQVRVAGRHAAAAEHQQEAVAEGHGGVRAAGRARAASASAQGHAGSHEQSWATGPRSLRAASVKDGRGGGGAAGGAPARRGRGAARGGGLPRAGGRVEDVQLAQRAARGVLAAKHKHAPAHQRRLRGAGRPHCLACRGSAPPAAAWPWRGMRRERRVRSSQRGAPSGCRGARAPARSGTAASTCAPVCQTRAR